MLIRSSCMCPTTPPRAACSSAAGRSYIFSQTVFSQKKGVRSWINGALVCVLEMALFFSNIDLMVPGTVH